MSMTHRFNIILIIIGTLLFIFGFTWRIYDAQTHGDVMLALQQDSFMGWSLTHIFGLAGFFLAFIGFLKWEKKTHVVS